MLAVLAHGRTHRSSFLLVRTPTWRRRYKPPVLAVRYAENEPQRSDLARRIALGTAFEIEVEAPFGSPFVLRGKATCRAMVSPRKSYEPALDGKKMRMPEPSPSALFGS